MPHREIVINGVGCPSVTQVLGLLDKPFLYRWYADLGWEKAELQKKTAQERGERFHKAVEDVFKNGIEPKPEDADIYEPVNCVRKWAKDKFFCKECEITVKSSNYMYGGTFDAVGEIDGNLTIVDWKLTSRIADTYVLQLAAYAQAWFEEKGTLIDYGRVVRPYTLLKPAKETSVKETTDGYKYSFEGSKVYIEEKQYTNLKHYLDVFLDLRDVWDFLNKKGMWEK